MTGMVYVKKEWIRVDLSEGETTIAASDVTREWSVDIDNKPQVDKEVNTVWVRTYDGDDNVVGEKSIDEGQFLRVYLKGGLELRLQGFAYGQQTDYSFPWRIMATD